MHRESLLDQLMPRAPLEEILADRIVDLSWRLKRAAQDQEAAFGALYEKYLAQQAGAEPEAGSAGGTGIPSASLSGQALPVNPNHGQARPEPCERDAHATAGTLGPDDPGGLHPGGGPGPAAAVRTADRKQFVPDAERVTAGPRPTPEGGAGGGDHRWNDGGTRTGRPKRRGRLPAVGLLEVSPGPAGRDDERADGPRYPILAHSPSWQDAGPAPEGPPEDETCKTNPIPEEVSSVKCQVSSEPSRVWSPGSLSTSSFTLQTSGPAPTARDETCKTNPISEEVSSVKCQVPSELCKTNPMCDRISLERRM